MVTGIPNGLRDILPVEAAERRQIESLLKDVFEQWGYGEVITPAFEYYEALSSESGELIQREMFKLFDKDGQILALRPELTTPIARLVAQRLKSEPFPIRFFYLQNVFREEPARRGQQREFNQAGIELIGMKPVQADAEVLTVLIESLQATGLMDFKIAVGNVGFLKAVFKDADITEQNQKLAIEFLATNDFVGYQNLLDGILDANYRKLLENIPYLRGSKALDDARRLSGSSEATKELETLLEAVSILDSQGLMDYIEIDLGIARNFDYYTGLVFEGYAEGLGFSFCGGGRYDNLLGKFDLPMPATGFQIGLERLQILLLKRNAIKVGQPIKYLVGYAKDVRKAFKSAAVLRGSGKTVSLAENCNFEEGIALARKLAFDFFVMADDAEGPITFELSTGKKGRLESEK